MMLRLFVSFILCLMNLPLVAQESAQQPAKVQAGASIKPLQLLMAAVTEGAAETPLLFMSNGADAHHYTLRPSDRQAMADSDLVLWVGPALEMPLASVMAALDGQVVTAQELPEMELLPAGDGIDPHLWLSTHNVIVMAEALASHLGRLDSANAERYLANSAALANGLRQLDERTRQRLAALDKTPAFAVYHDAFAYLEQQLGFVHQVSFTDNEDVAPGVRRLLQIQEKMVEHDVRCVLVEPGVDVRRLQNVVDNVAVRYLELDPLAWEFPVSGTAFLAFMTELNDTFVDCLSL